MPGIDYSRWDKLECSSSSNSTASDDANNEEKDWDGGHHTGDSKSERGVPKVVRMGHPTSVTVGPSGVQLSRPHHKALASPFRPSASLQQMPPTQKEDADMLKSPSPVSSTPQACEGRHATQMNEEGSFVDVVGEGGGDKDDDEDLLYYRLARNGGREGTQHWWSQTEDSATVSFLVPWVTTAKMVTDFSLREVKSEESCQHHARLEATIQMPPRSVDAAGDEERQAGSTPPAAALHICREFCYPIKLAADLVEGCWQLHRMPQRHLRLLVVEVFKEPIGQGMTLWWDRCFVTDTVAVVDTRTISDRVQRAAAAGFAAQEKADQFRKVWDEAHEEFRRRMRERKAAAK
jgi:hypothetical protein